MSENITIEPAEKTRLCGALINDKCSDDRPLQKRQNVDHNYSKVCNEIVCEHNYSKLCSEMIDDHNYCKLGSEIENDHNYTKLCKDSVDYSRDVPTTSSVTFYDLIPDVFRVIIVMFLRGNNWRKLVPLRLVCHYWRENIDSYLASKKVFSYTGRIKTGLPPPVMNYYEFNAMLSFHPNIKTLMIKNFTVSDHIVAILRQNLPKLEILSLDKCPNIGWKAYTILSVRFNLTVIEVSNCDLDENRMSIILENLRNLKVFKAMWPGRGVTFECLCKIGPNIEDIWIGMRHMVDCNPSLKALVSGNGKNVLNFGISVANYHTTDWSIITNNMKQLKNLKLTFGSFKSDSLKVFGTLKNLEFVVLAEDSHKYPETVLTDDSLIYLLRRCSQLKVLNVIATKPNTCQLSYQSIAEIPSLGKNIEQIRFLNTQHINDACLAQLGKIPTLIVLHLSSVIGVTNQGIEEFLKLSKRVRNFRISQCSGVNEDIIDVWIKLAKMRSNENLKLFIDGMVITKNLTDIPRNLTIDIKPDTRIKQTNNSSD